MPPKGPTLDRRTLLAAAGAVAVAPGASAWAAQRRRRPQSSRAEAALRALETRTGGRLGLAALDIGTGRRLDHRADERFPMCSTFKWLAVAAVLARVDRGQERLERVLPFGEQDLLDYAPVTKARVRDGAMPLGELCAAAVELSDNTAANLILQTLGGPAGLTRWLRIFGDEVTRLDRNEPTLNTAELGDPRDTTTPAAMVADLNRVLLGPVLTPASQARLIGWMEGCRTGLNKLRAGLPGGWRVGDKTGNGPNGTSNDVAIAWPPKGGPILIACYLTQARVSDESRDSAIAEAARIATAALGHGAR